MPDYIGNDDIIVQPGTFDYPYEFLVTVCSAAGANDGFLAFGRTIASVENKAFKHGRTLLEDSQLIENDSINGFVITMRLSYPTTNGPGRYKLESVVTLDDGSKEEIDFGRCRIKDH